MKTPKRLEPLVEDGLIDEVLRQLMSGKEAAYFGRFAPEIKATQYAKEMWALYEAGKLHVDVELTGQFTEEQVCAEEKRRQAARAADEDEAY